MNGLRVRGSITSLVTDQPRFNQSLDAAKYGSPKWNEGDIREAFFAYRMLSRVFQYNRILYDNRVTCKSNFH